jgi:DinB superfamily
MNAESLRIADQLRRAFIRDAWHGSPLLDLLDDVSPDQARARPLAAAHSIWELVLHIDFWVQAAWNATQDVAMPKMDGAGGLAKGDWPALTDTGAVAWFEAQDRLFKNAERLIEAIETFEDAKLQDTVPGREYNFYRMFHGIVQHSLYHGGQIAILKKARSAG